MNTLLSQVAKHCQRQEINGVLVSFDEDHVIIEVPCEETMIFVLREDLDSKGELFVKSESHPLLDKAKLLRTTQSGGVDVNLYELDQVEIRALKIDGQLFATLRENGRTAICTPWTALQFVSLSCLLDPKTEISQEEKKHLENLQEEPYNHLYPHTTFDLIRELMWKHPAFAK